MEITKFTSTVPVQREDPDLYYFKVGSGSVIKDRIRHPDHEGNAELTAHLRTLDRVQDGEALLQVVEPVLGVGQLETQVQVQLGGLHLLERLLELAGLQHGHYLAMEGQAVARIQV